MRIGRIVTVAAAATLIAFLTPTTAQGQDNPWNVGAQIGLGVPAANTSDLVNTGLSGGFHGTYYLNSRVGLTGAVDLGTYPGKDVDRPTRESLPDIDFYHYTAGLEFRIVRPQTSSVDLNVNLRFGGSTMDSDPVPTKIGPLRRVTESYFSASGGARLGVDVAENVNLFLSGQYYQIFTDEGETFGLGNVIGQSSGFSSMGTFPLTIGFRARI